MMFLRLLFLISFTHATYLYFDRESYDIYISESTSIYTRIGWIKAMSSPALSIQYELHSDTNNTFYLNSVTGELILMKSVDYETISMYTFTIEAHSSSTIAPCFSELIIHIINTNDNAPEINLIVYPSVLYETNIIKYDLNTSSTPFATINIQDLDESTKSLTLSLNDTEHFQIQLIRQIKNHLIYILSTKNNSQLIHHDNYYLLLNSCDNDQPILCTNQSYIFHMQSNEYLCNLSFSQRNYIIDVKENLVERTLLMHRITNRFCENVIYSIDDTENFHIDSKTGDLFTLKKFNRIEQSIYLIHLFINNDFKVKIFVRILDQYGNIPFLINKNLLTNLEKLSSIHIFNSTLCHSQPIIEKYFQLLSNCTIIPLIKPPKGQYLFNIELTQQITFQDTFLLDIEDDEHISFFTQTQWIIIIPIILGILVIIGAIIVVVIIIKQKRFDFNQLCQDKQRASSLSSNDNSEDDKSHYNRYDALSSISKLKVHDDYELSPSSTITPIYLIQKSSPPLSSFSPVRDDEGYSGSSDVSENHLPFESTIISGNSLLEQYRIHQFHNQQTIPSLYDVPRRYINKMNVPCVSSDVTLV